jgi:hypothetical protein
MKSCPTCNRTFADETLTYCLADGSLLSAPYNPEETQRLPLSRITNPTKTEVLLSTPTAARPVRQANNSAFKFIVIALLALIAGGGIMAWLNSRSREAASNSSPANKSPAVTNASAPPASSTTPPRAEARPPLGITATASSERSPESGVTYGPGNVTDQSLATAWDEGVDGPGIGEWVRFDFDREIKLNRIIITPGYFKTPGIWRQNNRLAGATFYFSDGSSRHFTFPDQMVERRLEVGGIRTRWVRLEISDIYPGSVDAEDTPISSLAFDWE